MTYWVNEAVYFEPPSEYWLLVAESLPGPGDCELVDVEAAGVGLELEVVAAVGVTVLLISLLEGVEKDRS